MRVGFETEPITCRTCRKTVQGMFGRIGDNVTEHEDGHVSVMWETNEGAKMLMAAFEALLAERFELNEGPSCEIDYWVSGLPHSRRTL